MLLDLSSAFDTDDHSILLSKMKSRFSVTSYPLKWFQSYLSGCTQVFVPQSRETLPVLLTSGVPQVSSLQKKFPHIHIHTYRQTHTRHPDYLSRASQHARGATKKGRQANILLYQLGLAGFSMVSKIRLKVSVRIRVRF